MNKISVPNAKIMTNTGFKNVVLSHNFKARPVIYVQRSGYRRDRCTFQAAQPDDIILSVSWNRHNTFYDAKRITSIANDRTYTTEDISALNKPSDKEVDEWIKSISPEIISLVNIFLLDRNELYLPEGLGWNGIRTSGDINKERKIREFFSFMTKHENIRDKIIEKSLISKKDGLPMDWSQAKELPTELRSYSKSWDGSVVNINIQEAWILFREDSSYDYIVPLPTDGEWGSNYAHSESGTYNNPPIPTPNNVVKAIKLTFGAYTREHFSYGIAWELYVKR